MILSDFSLNGNFNIFKGENEKFKIFTKIRFLNWTHHKFGNKINPENV